MDSFLSPALTVTWCYCLRLFLVIASITKLNQEKYLHVSNQSFCTFFNSYYESFWICNMDTSVLVRKAKVGIALSVWCLLLDTNVSPSTSLFTWALIMLICGEKSTLSLRFEYFSIVFEGFCPKQIPSDYLESRSEIFAGM